MRKRYQKWIEDWETRLTDRDTNRIVRPFEWGLDWIHDFPGVTPHGSVNGRPSPDAGNPVIERYIHDLNDKIVAHSDEFFSYATPTDFRLERRELKLCATGIDKDERNAAFNPEGKTGEFLRFTSPVRTQHPANDAANARWFPARGRRA